MRKLILSAGLLLIITSLAYSSKLVCYVTSWSRYRESIAKFKISSNIDSNLCTHLIFAFANMENNELVTYSSDDEEYQHLNNLKQSNPDLKTLLALGGANFPSYKFSNMVSTTNNRQTFIASTITLLRTKNLDGINLDWEYPQVYEKDKFTLLCKELYKACEVEAIQTSRPRLLVTSAVSAYKLKIDESYDVPTISRYMDFINVMTFDFHGSWDRVTGHHSPLYKRPGDTGTQVYKNAEYAMEYWRDQGTPSSKLVMGIGTYGRTFTLSSPDSSIGAPISGPGVAGPYTREAGFLSYYEICGFLKTESYMWSEAQKVPYGVKGNQWVGYDDKNSIDFKADFIRENEYGGVFVWSLDMDDFNGAFCGMGKYPLVGYLHRLLVQGASTKSSSETINTTTSTNNPTTTNANNPTTTNANNPTTTNANNPTTTTTTTTSSGKIDENFCNGKENKLYSNPNSPSSFYSCYNGITYIQVCPDGLVFNDSCQCCNWS